MSGIVRQAAHYVYAGNGILKRESYVELIGNSYSIRPLTKEIANTVFYNGILIPIVLNVAIRSEWLLGQLKEIQKNHPSVSLGEALSYFDNQLFPIAECCLWLLECNLQTLCVSDDSKISVLPFS